MKHSVKNYMTKLYRTNLAPNTNRVTDEPGGPLDCSEVDRDLDFHQPVVKPVTCPPNSPELAYAEGPNELPEFSEDDDDWRL